MIVLSKKSKFQIRNGYRHGSIPQCIFVMDLLIIVCEDDLRLFGRSNPKLQNSMCDLDADCMQFRK